MEKLTLMQLFLNEMMWNKEKIQIIVDDESFYSRIDRLEFLMYEFEDCIIDWFESGSGTYCENEISIIIFHVSRVKE